MFSLSTMHILALDINIYLCADSRNVVTVSANSKRDLEEMVTSLDKGIQPIVKCDRLLKIRFSTQ